MQVQAKSNQGGTLYELPLIGMALIIAGTLLGPKHAGFFILCLLGLLVLFLPYVFYIVFTIKNRIRLGRVLSDLRQSGFAVQHVIIGSRAEHAVVFDACAGNLVWIGQDGLTTGKVEDIDSVQLVPVIWTRLGGPERTVHTVRFTYNGKNTDFEQPGLWRARRVMRKLKKYLANTTVVIEK